MDAVRAFAGDDAEAAVVAPQARAVLSSFDEAVAHYDVVLRGEQTGATTPHRRGPTA